MTSPLALLTAAEMQRVDAAAIACGEDGYRLMCAAGAALAARALELHGIAEGGAAGGDPHGNGEGSEIVVCAGPGNNGGDGAVVARCLRGAGRKVTLCTIGVPREGGDAARAFADFQGTTLRFEQDRDAVLERIASAGLVVDALLGAGLSRPIEGEMAALIAAINASPAAVLAADLPSGLDGDTHLASGPVVQADATVTFVRYKPAHLLYPGRALCGDRTLADIGMPRAALEAVEATAWFNAPTLWLDALAVPQGETHKYRRGHVLVRAGSLASGGAARLAANAALGCGAGLVTLACPASATLVNAARLDAVMLARLDAGEDLSRLLEDARFTTLLLGPGNGRDALTLAMVEVALASGRDCVLDADALDGDELIEWLAKASGECVLTPHAGEFDRVFGRSAAAESKLDRARAAAARAASVVVFKGADTVVAAPDGRACIAGNAPPWLATAGAGDVLAGLVAALLAQGAPAFEAASAAVWLHGEAARTLGYPMTAEQLASAIGRTLGALLQVAPPALPGGLDDGPYGARTR